MVLGEQNSYMPKKMKLDHQFTPYAKVNSRWIQDLNISHDTIKVLEKNMGRKISDIPCSNIFTHMSPKARDIKERINKWYLIKLKSFFMAKENISKRKGNQLYEKTYLPMISQTRIWYAKYIKNSHDSTLGKQKIPIKNGHRTWMDTSPKRAYRGPRDIWKDAKHH